jgi:2,3-bisphosphoglycerate-independent phosphoglycerate mutase
MKYVILVGDGMGDHPIPELDNKTVLEAAHKPHMDALARGGLMGLADTLTPNKEAGSDVANMSIMGYDPDVYHTGRGPLEAASMGIGLAPGELAFRLNLVTLEMDNTGPVYMRDHSAGHIGSEEAAELIEYLARRLPLSQGQKLFSGVSYRHLMVWPGLRDGLPTIPPHDYRDQAVTDYLNQQDRDFKPVLDLIKASWPLLADHPINVKRAGEGRRAANSIWLWGQGRAPAMPTYQERWGVTGAVVSAVDLIKGLGVYAGLTPLDVTGATGLVDTNFEGKVKAALETLREHDFVLVHVEAPDEAGHQGDVRTKVRAVELFDERIVGPIWAGLRAMGDFRMLVLCDHYTPIEVKTHTREPVPFILYPASSGSNRVYTESEAAATGVYVKKGHTLVDLLFKD